MFFFENYINVNKKYNDEFAFRKNFDYFDLNATKTSTNFFRNIQ